jgi:uncharacterized HAD superfamily protein
MRIGVDLDEVLCEFLRGLIEFHNLEFGSDLVFDDFFSFEFDKVWGGSFDDMILKIKKYHESDYFLNAAVVPGAINAIKNLSQEHDLFVITARWNSVKSETLSWLDKHFNELFKDVYFVNRWSIGGEELSKGDICDNLNIDLFIDDYAPYAIDSLRGSRRVILFNRPWNKNVVLPENIIRVNSWDECLRVIKSLKN